MDDSSHDDRLAGKTDGPRARHRGSRARPRRASQGDIPPNLSSGGIEDFSVSQAILAANESKAMAVEDILKRLAREKSPSLVESLRRSWPAPRRTTSTR